MIERRKYIRLDSCVDVSYRISSKNLGPDKTVSKDISAGGIRIVVKEKLPPQSTLNLEINLPDDAEPIKVSGEVVWQQESSGGQEIETGVKYLQIRPQDMQRITDYVLSCVGRRLAETQRDLHTARKSFEFFTREIRLPGDSSPTVTTPSFLVHEINLPGDKVRYARIKSTVGLKYKLLTGTKMSGTSLSQYVSGKGVWFLSDQEIPQGSVLEVEITLPDSLKTLAVIGEAVSCKEETRYTDTEVKTCYEVGVKFTIISGEDRKRIIRYVYACQADYIMLGKEPPSSWLQKES